MNEINIKNGYIEAVIKGDTEIIYLIALVIMKTIDQIEIFKRKGVKLDFSKLEIIIKNL